MAASGCRGTPTRSDRRNEISEADRDYYLERKYPSFGNLAPRDISSRAAKEVCDEGRGVGPGKRGVYLDFREAISLHGRDEIRKRYGNLFDMYRHITGEDPYASPMRIYPAPHYTMGGLWVDYNLMSNVPGLFVIGEANFSDHGANRLGASALMQGLRGWLLYLALHDRRFPRQDVPRCVGSDNIEFKEAETETGARLNRLLCGSGKRTATRFHRELGKLMIEACGMSRSEEGLRDALDRIPDSA